MLLPLVAEVYTVQRSKNQKSNNGVHINARLIILPEPPTVPLVSNYGGVVRWRSPEGCGLFIRQSHQTL